MDENFAKRIITKYDEEDRNQIAPSVLILKEKETYQAIMLNQSLAKSLFTRLYFLNGAGLAHFKPFLEEKDGEGAIKIFEIIW